MDKKKIAFVFYGDLSHQRGAFNASLNRIKNVITSHDFAYEVFLFTPKPSYFMRLIKKIPQNHLHSSICISGVKINLVQFPFTLIDYISQSLFHSKPFIEFFYTKNKLSLFRDFDLLSVHSTEGGQLALLVNQKYRKPFIITWHGGDIHTTPYVSKYNFRLTETLLSTASANIFVSKDLLFKSERILNSEHKFVLYNGVDRYKFFKYSEDDKLIKKKQNNILLDTFNVGFVGNFYDVKNVLKLPGIFRILQNKYPNRFHFYFIGSGKLESKLDEMCKQFRLHYSILHGIDNSKMPDIYNCMDLIVLPSKNEGLPLVCAEALACGVPMVGSRVGGMPEIIGEKNTVLLDDNFDINFAQLINDVYNSTNNISLSDQFDWKITSDKEINIIKSILAN